MDDRVLVSMTTSAFVALATLPLFQRLALAVGFVDEPAARKVHERPIAYLGGLGIAAGFLTGVLAGHPFNGRAAVVVAAALVLCLTGLADDRVILAAMPRLVVQVGAAAAACAAGVRIGLTGAAAVDVAITLVWIVGITNALNLLDNMDGLAGSVAFLASLGVALLADAEGQLVVACVAGAVAGAVFGFLAYNIMPAAMFMGDAGALMLGFLVAVSATEVDVAVGKPGGYLVPLLLLVLPVVDTTTVTLARIRRSRSVAAGGKDHLSHRLVASGMSQGGAVAALALAQTVLVIDAVLLGRNRLSWPLAVALSVVVLAPLCARAWWTPVYDEPVVGFRQGLRRRRIGRVAP